MILLPSLENISHLLSLLCGFRDRCGRKFLNRIEIATDRTEHQAPNVRVAIVVVAEYLPFPDIAVADIGDFRLELFGGDFRGVVVVQVRVAAPKRR